MPKTITINGIELHNIGTHLWEIPKQGDMLVPGRIYISEEMATSSLQKEEAVKQVVNVAHLPGIQKYSLAMPDIHWGYGFPIGGVAATDFETGVISPGGVGYDINCGVRLATTSIPLLEIKPKIDTLIQNLFKAIPTGVGSSGAIRKLNKKELLDVGRKGAGWAVEQGYGTETDLEHTEEQGCMKGASPELASERAIERGLDQAGTLGSGNHFLEIDMVDEIYDEQAAEAFGLFRGQMVIQIHTGSRGFGYQICDDHLKTCMKAMKKYDLNLPDKQLACAPLSSPEGSEYLSTMKAAANFAWNNRQIIMSLARESILKTLGMKPSELGFSLLYDVAHNIAKIEDHVIDGQNKKVCVHRKGATRAFPPNSPFIPNKYKNVGQPVLIPGDMGRYSFVCAGTEKSLADAFGSSCHGAGRVMSRRQALKSAKGKDLIGSLKDRGISIQARGHKTIAEEMPEAYKDVSEVIDVVHEAGICYKVAKLKPFGVIKG